MSTQPAEQFISQKQVTKGQPPESLVEALHYGDRRVQGYEAVRLIMKYEPTGPFAGAGEFNETLLHLARSTGQRRALAAFPNGETAAKMAGYLNGLGLMTDVATNVTCKSTGSAKP